MAGAADLEELYLRYRGEVYRRARALLGSDDAARDATQEIFLRVITAGGHIPCEPTPTAWLHRVTTNHCLNLLRDVGRRKEILTVEYQPGATTTEAVGEQRALVLEILARVPEELQEIALHFFLDELTYGEIARLTCTSKRTVGNRLVAFRAMVDQLCCDPRLAS